MNVFEAVKQFVTTREVAEFYGFSVNRAGMIACPFHNDRTPSMKVDKRFHCFGCGADGDAVDFKLERTVFESIQQKVLGLLSVSGNTEYMHSIANLALLNTADNAALNNSTFDVKRNDIIQMDKKGQYIPFCTKMVFLKYYTPSAENQLHFWGQADRIAYIRQLWAAGKKQMALSVCIKKFAVCLG